MIQRGRSSEITKQDCIANTARRAIGFESSQGSGWVTGRGRVMVCRGPVAPTLGTAALRAPAWGSGNQYRATLRGCFDLKALYGGLSDAPCSGYGLGKEISPLADPREPLFSASIAYADAEDSMSNRNGSQSSSDGQWHNGGTGQQASRSKAGVSSMTADAAENARHLPRTRLNPSRGGQGI